MCDNLFNFNLLTSVFTAIYTSQFYDEQVASSTDSGAEGEPCEIIETISDQHVGVDVSHVENENEVPVMQMPVIANVVSLSQDD